MVQVMGNEFHQIIKRGTGEQSLKYRVYVTIIAFIFQSARFYVHRSVIQFVIFQQF